LNEQLGISLSAEALQGLTIEEKVKYVKDKIVESLKQEVKPVEHREYEMTILLIMLLE